MTSISLTPYGTYARTFSSITAPVALTQLANVVSKLSIPLIGLSAFSSIPSAEAKHAKGGKNDDVFVQCIKACDKNGKDANELAKLLCYTMCLVIDLFKNKK
ncbi:MAG TPA: hypothetical protein VLE95_01685 [Chlamydiales bacterium]|nr:hypothetical protein [Chlamydiales bacterium]